MKLLALDDDGNFIASVKLDDGEHVDEAMKACGRLLVGVTYHPSNVAETLRRDLSVAFEINEQDD